MSKIAKYTSFIDPSMCEIRLGLSRFALALECHAKELIQNALLDKVMSIAEFADAVLEIASDNDIRTIWSEQIGSDFLAQMFVYSRKSARIESVIKAGDFKILPELRPGRVEISFLFYRNGYKKPQFRLTLWLDEDGDYVTERLTGGVFS